MNQEVRKMYDTTDIANTIISTNDSSNIKGSDRKKYKIIFHDATSLTSFFANKLNTIKNIRNERNGKKTKIPIHPQGSN